MRISRNVIVAGYALDKALTRVRALRKDGAESLLAMSVALLYLADVRTGFVGKPRQGGGPWQRYTLRDLAQLAYGAQTGAELERAKRSIDMMVSLGWAFPTKQVRRHTKDAEGRDGGAASRACAGSTSNGCATWPAQAGYSSATASTLTRRVGPVLRPSPRRTHAGSRPRTRALRRARALPALRRTEPRATRQAARRVPCSTSPTSSPCSNSRRRQARPCPMPQKQAHTPANLPRKGEPP